MQMTSSGKRAGDIEGKKKKDSVAKPGGGGGGGGV